jgi:hypothetical protein
VYAVAGWLTASASRSTVGAWPHHRARECRPRTLLSPVLIAE